MRKKTYKITDLFITSWTDDNKRPTLTPKQMAELIALRYSLDDAIRRKNSKAEGHWSIKILELLRKDRSAVSEITVEQVVDCIADITFFRDPWFFFPKPKNEVIWSAPDEYMHDRTIEQLVYADSAFTKYLVLEDRLRNAHPPMDAGPLSELEIDELIGVLYTRPSDFDSAKIGDRTDDVKGLFTEAERTLIFHTYANIRDYIVKRYPMMFPKATGDTNESKSPVHSGPMWRDLLYDFSETDAFKGYDQARTARIYTALDYLEKKTKDLHELKRQSAK